jgi:pyruvate-ferredoxin/flavodoxin oxidoreductase
MAMTYGHVYVARVAMGANDAQCIRAFLEAEAYEGPSLIIAYSHCINHGLDLRYGLEQQKRAVESGHWILSRYNPDLAAQGKNPLILDGKEPTLPLREYVQRETRYQMLFKSDPAVAEALLAEEEREVRARWRYYKYLSEMPVGE